MKVEQFSCNRDVRYDMLRIAAALLVILLHVSAFYGENVSNTYKIGSLFFNSLSRPCVPLFFMLTGAFLLRRNIEISTLYREKVLKIFFVFVIWSFVYICFNGQLFHKNVFSMLLKGEFHLWFLLRLCGVYMMLPVLSAIVHYEDGKLVPYYLGCFFVFGLIVPELNQYTAYFMKINIDIIGVDIVGFTGYVVLGYYLLNVWQRKINVSLLLLAFVVAVLFPFIVNSTSLYLLGKVKYCSFGYLMMSTAVKAVVLFLLFKKIPQNISQYSMLRKWVSKLSQLTFGVYLLHPLIMYICLPFQGYSNGVYSELFCILADFIVVVVLSFLLSYVIISLPYLKKAIMMK